MNKRQKNQLRDRVSKRLIDEERFDEAKAAWGCAWAGRHPMATKADVERARLAMLVAIDKGETIPEAEKIAERVLTKGENA